MSQVITEVESQPASQVMVEAESPQVNHMIKSTQANSQYCDWIAAGVTTIDICHVLSYITLLNIKRTDFCNHLSG